MKKKSFVIVWSCLLFSSMAVSAQEGLYSVDDLTSPTDNPSAGNDGFLRDTMPGGGGEEPSGAPIGGGLLILSALAGGYAVIKKRKSSKEQSL